MTDDDLEEHLDPELDPTPESNGWELPGPITLAGLVASLHFLVALLFIPAAWTAFQSGSIARTAFLSGLIVLITVGGIVAGRITDRRFG